MDEGKDKPTETKETAKKDLVKILTGQRDEFKNFVVRDTTDYVEIPRSEVIKYIAEKGGIPLSMYEDLQNNKTSSRELAVYEQELRKQAKAHLENKDKPKCEPKFSNMAESPVDRSPWLKKILFPDKGLQYEDLLRESSLYLSRLKELQPTNKFGYRTNLLQNRRSDLTFPESFEQRSNLLNQSQVLPLITPFESAVIAYGYKRFCYCQKIITDLETEGKK
jgi:hypothetical protein